MKIILLSALLVCIGCSRPAKVAQETTPANAVADSATITLPKGNIITISIV